MVAGEIAVIAGGVGAARFLRGAIAAVDDPQRITAVVNTGDDIVLHGLSISPDLDTITYTLAGAIDPERGWGLVDETWSTLRELERFAEVKPERSTAGATWFSLGDRDLATHLYRTARLAEGATLTDVTVEVGRAWNVPIRLVPMSDDRCSTVITTALGGDEVIDISFQDYFVRLRHDVPIRAVRFEGEARLSSAARDALDAAARVVIAPSNPIVSIGPIRSLPGVEALLGAHRERVVAISPIVGGAALKGPADRMLRELGHEPSVVGVAHLYAPIASTLVIDTVDAGLRSAVEAEGVRCVVAPTVMSSPQVSRDLASLTFAAP